MFKRKILALIMTILISTPIIGFCFLLVERSDITQLPSLTLFILIFATPFVVIFGIPASIISDKINKRFIDKKRKYASFVTHLFFAVCFVVLFILFDQSRFIFTQFNSGDLYFLVPAIIYSVVGWFLDEILRKRLN